MARRLARLLEHRGLGAGVDPVEADPLADSQPFLSELFAASVASRVATGRRAGQRVLRLGDRIDADDLPAPVGERCASVRGVSLPLGALPLRRPKPLRERIRQARAGCGPEGRMLESCDPQVRHRAEEIWRVRRKRPSGD